MNHVRLFSQLDRVAWRFRLLRMWQFMAAVWLLGAAAALTLWLLKPPQANPLPLVCLTTVVAALATAFLATRSARDYQWLAHRVESAFPELQTCLLTALEQQPGLPNGRFGYLQGRVIHQALTHARKHPWPDVVSPQWIALSAAGNVVCFTLFAATIAALGMNVLLPTSGEASGSPTSATGGEFRVTVEPGDTEVERGTSLLVLARVHGPIPAESTLVYQSDAGEETRAAMSASLNDPVFGGRISAIEQPLRYHVEIGGQTTPEYRVTVFEFPRLDRADAHLDFPTYTGLEPRIVQDVRTISAVEGTKLTLRCFLNKAVTFATLIDTAKDNPGASLPLAVSPEASLVYEITLVCDQSRRFKLELIDDAGRQNVKSYDFKINVLRNQPPNLKPTFPAKDLEVSALEELDVKATVWDDFGVAKLGLSYSLGDAEPVDIVLAENALAKQKHEIAHVVRLEELKAEPDQLLSYHWWAEDIGPDGQPRRTFSDMYFAEVRPFEEIFRQGEQPPGGQQQQGQQGQGQGQNAQQAQQLAQLQKDIINATWKLIRRETRDQLSAAFAEDAEQVQLSQEQALAQASALAERVQDEQSQEHVGSVLQHMQTAAEQLKAASGTPASEPLKPALAAAQSAYQSLLKLRAREHEVVRQQQQQQQGQQSSSQQSSSRSQQQSQQLQQLDLQEEENRYETERAAQERQQESAEDRENRQVQNRLRELARRQNDVNERLKELQSALEEARSEEQKEEIRRQLKRLQDEQRQILQDTDELQSRMEQPENAERMAEERQQLEETRDQVRRASEALEEQRVTQAAAAGTRAEQQFDELREEFRRRAANAFNEEMQEMRQAARELDEKEQRIAEQIQQAVEPQQDQPTLREDDPREKIAGELSEQRERLENLQEQMRQTIEQAEVSEPILSQRLYETVRNVQDRKLDQALQSTERSVRQGLPQDARQQEAAASDAIRQLREGVERAAEGVLGDGTESLRRAREELRDLTKELNQEIRRNTGQEQPSEEQPGEENQGQRDQGENPMPGRSQAGEQQGERGQGERSPPQGQQPGESQAGQNQPGQRGQGQPEEREPMEQQQPGQGQPGQGQGDQQPSGEPQPGERQPGERQPGQRGQRGQQRLGDPLGGGSNAGGDPRGFTPLTGEDFRAWSDRLRDVEEMVDDAELRAEAARIRERARGIRAEIKRHSAEPNWDLVQQQVAGPLVELRDRVSEELLRRTSKKAIVPLDRDPVPPQYSEKTRRYYERLGSGK